MATVSIKTDNALSDAQEIVSIIKNIEESLETLNNNINKNIPDVLRTDWADELKSNWTKYYSNDIPETMSQMNQSAINIQKTAEDMIKYSQEQ